MEAVYVAFWVLLVVNPETKESHIGDKAYLTNEECSKANSLDIKGRTIYCSRVKLPLSKFKELQEVVK
jgi:hypothetical protein